MEDTGIDKENMKSVLERFPEQVIKGFKLAENIKVLDKVDSIIIAGMGGSALPGEILKSYLYNSRLPIFVCKGYSLPEFISSKTLVFAISYSGNTEETLSAYRNALRKGCRIITISSGGKLQMLAEKQEVKHVSVPSGIPPRSAYGYLFFAILRVLQNSNIIDSQEEFVIKTVETLKKPSFREKAKELADQLTNKIPLVYSSDRLKAVAYKWKISFNENSKVHAFYNVFPELNHNEMVGFTRLNGSFYAILIRDEEDHERIRKRIAITKAVIKNSGVPVIEIALSGPCMLAKIISAIYVGDWASYYLALNYGIDPTPVEVIEEFKKQL